MRLRRELQTAVWFGLSVAAPYSVSAGSAALTRGPYLQALLETSVQVIWRTDLDSVGAVRFREGGGAEHTIAEPAASTAHRVKLADLTPGVFHFFQILDGDQVISGAPIRFHTAPPVDTGEVHVAVVGDSGDASKEQRAIATLIRGLEPDIFVHTGDLDYVDDIDRSVFAPYREILASACFYPSRGNHDIRLDWSEAFFPPNLASKGNQLFYSFDWGSAHFAAFDTNGDALAGGDQLRWLDADLDAARRAGRQWLIIFCHEPAYTVGGYSTEQRAAHEVIPPIADRHGVDLVLSGHDHNYQRSHPVLGEVVHDAWQSPTFVSPQGTIYLVSGGGGRQLYGEIPESDHRFTRRFIAEHHALELVIRPEEIRVRALSAEKEVLDEITLTKELPRPRLEIIRGDANADGDVNIADAVRILGHLFLGTVIDCRASAEVAADTNASGNVAIDDAIFLLGHLFLGGPNPPSPFPGCGAPAEVDDAFCPTSACRR